ncbi:MAG: tRNA (adenosine(37)-N6)-threonylcarbamoyltransferase complex dimerization subunit type 1 TsaB, partial [Thermosynechococcaceae cyanobacterium]
MSPDSSSFQYALGIDTASPTLRLGLSNFAEVNHHQAWTVGRDLSLYLHQHLSELIQPHTWSELTWIAVVKGPGGYTGTRLGVVTARTLAQQLHLPLYGVSTLALFAHAYCTTNACVPGTQVAVELLGQRGHVHGGVYQLGADGAMGMTQADAHLTLAEWEEALSHQQPRERLSASDHSLSDASLSQALLEIGQQHQGKQAPWE